jgi:hypothetical protein
MRPRLLGLLILASACSGGEGLTGEDSRVPAGTKSCAAGTALLTIPPVALADFFGWVPLGNLNPPGHTFPTDHQYIYVNDPGSSAPRREVAVVAPADLVITSARRQTITPGDVTDYTLDYSLCAEVIGEFGHVLTIAPAILAQLGAIDQRCTSYSPAPGSTASTCETNSVAIAVKAGDPLGTAGGPAPHSFGLDVSLWDTRVIPASFANPSRWQANSSGFDRFHAVPASDYFAEPARSQIAPRVGSFNGKVRRTALPAGGTLAVDVPGTAMGAWFNPTQPTYPEYMHLAIVPDNVDPGQIDISIGTLGGWNRGLVFFTPTSSGFVNRNPSQVTADGRIYCMEAPGAWVILMQLVDANTLRVDSPAALSCASAQPWSFGSGAFDFKR